MHYKCGQKFVLEYCSGRKDKYLLAQVGERQICLVSLDDGNRFTDAIKVSDPYRISMDEFDKLTGPNVRLVKHTKGPTKF